MAKTVDVPHAIRDFNKIFQELEYRHDTSSVFSDYLDYAVLCFLQTDEAERTAIRERIQRTYGKYYDLFPKLFREHVLALEKNVFDGGWYDLLGIYYEVIVSRSKSSAFGQFFTPPTVVDFMSKIIDGDKQKGLRVNDPACGSGRTLLSFHVNNLGNYLYGDDLDPMCTKMCAINFVMHGAVGQVCNVNSLWPDDWRFGYAVNPYLYSTGMVSLVPIQKEQSHTWQFWQAKKREHEQSTHEQPKQVAPEPKQTAPPPMKETAPPEPKPRNNDIGTQLTFF